MEPATPRARGRELRERLWPGTGATAARGRPGWRKARGWLTWIAVSVLAGLVLGLVCDGPDDVAADLARDLRGRPGVTSVRVLHGDERPEHADAALAVNGDQAVIRLEGRSRAPWVVHARYPPGADPVLRRSVDQAIRHQGFH